MAIRGMAVETASGGGRGGETPRVQVRGVGKSYAMGRGQVYWALRDVTLEVFEGETLVLLGRSGCGKTTLLRCVAGLELPDSGEICIASRCVFSKQTGRFVPPEERSVSMVFQSYALWPHMRVWENVAYPLENRRVARREARRIAEETLELVGLQELCDRFPGQLSGGQQQRVALARALAAGAEVILFDEPLSNLDAPIREQLRGELRALHKRTGWTAIYVTHDQREAAFLGDRVAVMDQGTVVQVGAPEEVYGRPNCGFVAQFTGCTNHARGRLLVAQGGQVRVGLESGALWAVWCAKAPPRVGEVVDVYWRPEQSRLRLVTDREGDADGLRVRVIGTGSLGFRVEYVVQGKRGGGPWRCLGDVATATGSVGVPGVLGVLEVEGGHAYVYPAEASAEG
jgi:iron(III) transport system ATP-binding protein